MNSLVALLALATVCVASPIGLTPTILNKVNVGPAQIDIVKQPITVQQTEYVYRNVPVPVRAVQYNPPVIAPTPIIHAAPALVAAPAISAYAAPLLTHGHLI